MLAVTFRSCSQVVLPHAIKVLKAAGYRLVSLAECLGQPAYTVVGPPAARDVSLFISSSYPLDVKHYVLQATWTCEGK